MDEVITFFHEFYVGEKFIAALIYEQNYYNSLVRLLKKWSILVATH